MKFTTEKSQLLRFLQLRGVSYNAAKKTWRCPKHHDESESAVYYEKGKKSDFPVLWCPVCAEAWSVFEVAGLLDNVTEFKDKLRTVRETLGISDDKPARGPQPFPPDRADEFSDKIHTLAVEKGWGDIAGSWKYHNAKGQVIGLDVRFEKPGEKKIVLTFWYDVALKWAKAPVMIYNLPGVINSTADVPVLIHEGAKCADAAATIPGFVHVSWSGGSAKADKADWSTLTGREVFIYPDDDEPGMKAAQAIRNALPHAKIIKPHPEARRIKPKGADIVEALQAVQPDALTAYILDPANHISDVGPSPTTPAVTASQDAPMRPSGDGSTSEMPFKCLGVGDDGRAVFITEAGRLEKYTLDGLSKNKLMVLTGRWWWRDHYAVDGKMNWDNAIDDIIRWSQNIDHHESNIRGRGAWRDGDKISYHDGITTHGEYDKKKIYLRLPRHDIGITDTPAEASLMKVARDAAFRLSFETRADAVRCLGWSVLAPFAGALKFRPAMLLTGPSGSGKSTVARLIIKRLADCLWLNGSESTVAGVRGEVQRDSRPVVFDETEADTEKKKINRAELFSLMRVNVSDDAPDTVKGTKEGGVRSYKMQNMFGFIAIDPTVDSAADENRIFRINMSVPRNQDNWKEIENAVLDILTEENCRAIRALTWGKLGAIFTLSDRIVDTIRTITGRDYRSSYADAMLAAAYMVVWTGTDAPTDEQIADMLNKYYTFQPVEAHRDEAAELITRLLDESIEVLHDENRREKLILAEVLRRIYRGVIENEEGGYDNIPVHAIRSYKRAICAYGIQHYDCDKIAIAHGHHMIMRVLGVGKGYEKIFRRFKGYVETKNVSFTGDTTRRATILGGVLKKRRVDMTDDEKLAEVI